MKKKNEVKSKKKAKKRSFLKKIEKYPTLEQLMWVVNGMEKCKVFTKLKLDSEGRIEECFTKKGAMLYGRLTDFIYGLFTLASAGAEKPMSFTANEIVEELDDILHEC
jgi:hypothetical protein